MQRVARDLATREFSGFQYAMVLHTFETDPDPHPSPHPHVHLTVKATGLDIENVLANFFLLIWVD